MKKIFYVDLEMCGGENLPPHFDLEEFCEVLQGKLTDIEVVPATTPEAAANRSERIVDPRVFAEALGQYCAC
jgi:hypothetical protein